MNSERLLAQFLDLVQIDSESGNERAVAEYTMKELEQMGFAVETDEAGQTIGGNSGNVIAKLKGNAAYKSVFFCAHMDTVKPGCGVKPQIKDGIIYSDGTTVLGGDDKGGISAILEGTRSFLAEQKKHGDIQIVFTIAEEGGLNGAKALKYEELWPIDGAFFFDSEDDASHVTVKAPVHYDFSCKFTGKAAHAGMEPEKGVNAIAVAAEAVSGMLLGRIDEDTTANIGLISGGKATNIVPEEALIEGEARSMDEAKVLMQMKHMREVCENAAFKYGAWAKVTIEKSHDGIDVPLDSTAAQMVTAACRKLGKEVSFIKSGGGSDANIMNGKGIPAVNIGVGMSNVHTTAEYIAIKDLEIAAQMVEKLLEAACD